MSLDKIKRDVKIQSGRYKRLLGDIKSYAKEIETLEGALNKALEIEDEGDRNSRVKLVNNQIEESTLALQDCVSRSTGAKTDLQNAIAACPPELHETVEYKDAVSIFNSDA